MKRRLFQIVFLVLLNLPFLGQWKMVCLPVLNCHSCPWAVMACPIGVLGHMAAWSVFPALALGTIGLFGVVLGRWLCGWVCPFGFLQDMLYKIPSPKFVLRPWTKWIKYVILGASVIVVPMSLGLLSYGFFCNICPAATLQSMFPYYLMGQTDLSWIRLGVLLFVLLLAVVSMRSFCKLFCPIGAILAIFNRFSALSLRYEQSNCPSCQICLSKCPMDIKMEQLRAPGNPEEVHTAPS
jgi:ferredoxin-type protein NapH